MLKTLKEFENILFIRKPIGRNLCLYLQELLHRIKI